MRMCTAPTAQLTAAAVVGLFVAVSTAQAVTINIGSATGAPGSTVMIQVTLSTMGAQVGGVSNNIVFDPATPIVDCQINPALNLSAWTLQPQGCTAGVDCQQARFLNLRFSSQSIPDGTVLYTCTIHIAANAPAQAFALVCSSPSGSTLDPPGPLTVECPNGQVEVALPTPTPTPNPATSGGGGSGCQIALMHGPDTHWPLFSMSAVAALWAWRRRRRRNISAVGRLVMRRRSR